MIDDEEIRGDIRSINERLGHLAVELKRVSDLQVHMLEMMEKLYTGIFPFDSNSPQ